MTLGAWFWRLYGPRMVKPFNREQISPASYDVTLGRRLIFYRYMGISFPGLEVDLDEDGMRPVGNSDITLSRRVRAGDLFLAQTREHFDQPRLVSLSFMLKSSTARGFLEHLHAGWGEHGFSGVYTLEFHALVDGELVYGQPIGQMVAHLTWGWHSYRDKRPRHYLGQQAATANKNTKRLAWKPWWQDEEVLRKWALSAGVDPELAVKSPQLASLKAVEGVFGK